MRYQLIDRATGAITMTSNSLPLAINLASVFGNLIFDTAAVDLIDPRTLTISR